MPRITQKMVNDGIEIAKTNTYEKKYINAQTSFLNSRLTYDLRIADISAMQKLYEERNKCLVRLAHERSPFYPQRAERVRKDFDEKISRILHKYIISYLMLKAYPVAQSTPYEKEVIGYVRTILDACGVDLTKFSVEDLFASVATKVCIKPVSALEGAEEYAIEKYKALAPDMSVNIDKYIDNVADSLTQHKTEYKGLEKSKASPRTILARKGLMDADLPYLERYEQTFEGEDTTDARIEILESILAERLPAVKKERDELLDELNLHNTGMAIQEQVLFPFGRETANFEVYRTKILSDYESRIQRLYRPSLSRYKVTGFDFGAKRCLEKSRKRFEKYVRDLEETTKAFRSRIFTASKKVQSPDGIKAICDRIDVLQKYIKDHYYPFAFELFSLKGGLNGKSDKEIDAEYSAFLAGETAEFEAVQNKAKVAREKIVALLAEEKAKIITEIERMPECLTLIAKEEEDFYKDRELDKESAFRRRLRDFKKGVGAKEEEEIKAWEEFMGPLYALKREADTDTQDAINALMNSDDEELEGPVDIAREE